MADDCEGRAGQKKHRWNPEAEKTICKDSLWERTFSERYLSVYSNLANSNLFLTINELHEKFLIVVLRASASLRYKGSNFLTTFR